MEIHNSYDQDRLTKVLETSFLYAKYELLLLLLVVVGLIILVLGTLHFFSKIENKSTERQ